MVYVRIRRRVGVSRWMPHGRREAIEVFRQAQTDGRLVYHNTGAGTGEQVTLDAWKPEEHTELFVAPRLAGG
jgi:hypothetical protein